MKCKFCSANIESNASICPYCNSNLIDTNVVVNNEVVSPTQPTVVENVTPEVVQQQVVTQSQVVSQPFVQPQMVPQQAVVQQQVVAQPQVVSQPVVQPQMVPQQAVVQQQVVAQPQIVSQPVVQPQMAPQQPMVQSAPVVQPMQQVQAVAPVSGTVGIEVTPPKKKKPILLIIILLIVVGVLIFAGIGIFANKELDNNTTTNEPNNTEHEINPPEEVEVNANRIKSDRVIMLYVIGSDLESKGGAATKDITEIIKSNFNQNDIDILAYVGGTKDWKNQNFNENENAIYEITNSDVVKLKTYEKKYMTKPSTLTEYLNYVYANYESDKYSLILWDHGGGPLFGYGVDENNPNSNEFMSIFDLDKAINDSMILKDGKLEFIGFDACLMSSIEVANILKEETNYFIASSETEPGDGWDYTFLKEINKNTTTVQLGKYIIDYYYNYFEDQSATYALYGYNYNPAVSLSMIDLTKIPNVNTSINNLFKDLGEDITVESYSRIAREASRATFFGLDENGVSQVDLIDLYDFTSELENYQSLATSVQSALSDAVIYHKTNIEGCYGLSMYFPSTTRKMYSIVESNYKYGEMIVAENYRSFLKRYTAISSGDKLVKSDFSTVAPSISSSNIQATIPNDMANNYEYADYLLFRKIKEDGSFLPVLKSKDVTINGNTISATTSNRRIAVGNAKGEDVEDVIAFEVSRDSKSITYMIVAILQKWEDDNYFGTFEIESVCIYLKVDNKTKKGTIVDIKPIKEEDDPKSSAKVSYNLNEWKIMQFVSSSYHLVDENGKKLDSWQKTDTMYGTEVDISEGYTFFADTLDKDEEYYYMFRVQDTQGNIYESNLVKAK